MNLRTQATLDELRVTDWFRSVGIQDTDAAEVLPSWWHAIKSCSTPEWEALCLEAANQFRERLAERDPERLKCWNDIVIRLKPISQALVRDKTLKVIKENDLPKAFLDTVDWDILHLLMEAEYSDVFPPGFYASQVYWYLKGHFPCGWKGQFPAGRLVIY